MSSKLKREIIELLKRDEEFRYTVAGLIGYGEVLEELKRLRADFSKRFEKHDKKFESIEEEIKNIYKRLEEHDRKFESIENEIKKLREDFNRRFNEQDEKLNHIQRRLDALGARWGLMSESAFREGMKGLIERYFGGKVEKWIYKDDEGLVFGYPSIIDVDLVVRDGEHILIEVKSHVDRSDLATLLRKGKLYEKVTGVKPKLAIISPYVDDKAKVDAKRIGIEVYTA
jgi:hypothetical protein